MPRPGPAVPIERPPAVEEVIDELRAPEGRSIDAATGALRHSTAAGTSVPTAAAMDDG